MATAKTFDEALGSGRIADQVRSLWLDQRSSLEDDGYNGDSWKRAAHEVWYSLPRQMRPENVQTEVALSALLGVSDRTLRAWRKANPERYQRGADSVRKLMQSWLPDVAFAAYDMAVHGGKDGASDRRLIFGAAGMVTEKTDITSGGAPMMAYTVLAHPDMWDDDDNNQANANAQPNDPPVGAAPVADRPVEG
ncbi:MAG: hypothetical protein KAX65_00085 [Caldilineaceae bacterium]|nr:hypothetical protein [Caldilineaceae bacterium]